METKNFSGLVVSNEPQANKKFFGAAVFQKCCRGVGEQPTFAKQIELHNEMKQKSKRKSQESQLPLKSEGCNKSQGFRGNCDSQGKLGMCPSLAEPVSGGFSKSHVSHETLHCNCSTGTVAKYSFLVPVSQGGAVLFAPPRKAVAFLTTPSVCQKHGTGISLPAGSDQGYSP